MGGGIVLIEIGKSNKLFPECVDREENCAENLCTDPIYGEFMLKFCTKTCLKCKKNNNNNLNINNVTEIDDNNFRLAAKALKIRSLKSLNLKNQTKNFNNATKFSQIDALILQKNKSFQPFLINHQIIKNDDSSLLKYKIKHCVDRYSK